MANFKLVNSDQLDSDLKKVADSIRAKGETKNQLKFPDGFVSSVNAIETGSKTTVKKTSGNVSIRNGAATVNCGFRPDVVVFGDSFCFYLENGYFSCDHLDGNTRILVSIPVTATSNGFKISGAEYYQDYYPQPLSYSVNYIAIKYTE